MNTVTNASKTVINRMRHMDMSSITLCIPNGKDKWTKLKDHILTESRRKSNKPERGVHREDKNKAADKKDQLT